MGRSRTIESANRLRFHRLMAAVLLGALLLVFITFGPLLFGGKDASPVIIDAKLTEIEEPKIDKDSDEYFKQQLAEGKIPTLKVRLAILQEESGLPVILRLRNIARQMAVGNRLLELDIDEETYNGVVEGMLLAIIKRESLAIKHSMFSAAAIERALEFASDPQIAEHAVHSDLAAATTALAHTSKFLFESKTENRIKLRIKAVEKFNDAAWRDKENESLAEKLFDLIGLVQDKGFVTEADQFVRAYLEAFAESKQTRISELHSELQLVLQQSESTFVNLIEVDATKRQQNVGQFASQMKQHFSQRDVHPAVVTMAINKLEQLVQIGQIGEIDFLKSQLSQFVNRSQDAMVKMAELDRIVSVASNRFSPAGLLKLDGRSVDDIDLNQRTILIFFSDSQIGETTHVVKVVGKSLGKRYADKELKYALVFLSDNDDQTPPKEIQNLAEKAGLEIWRLKKYSPSGRTFLKSFPIDKTPYTLILKNGNRVISLDSPAAIVGQIVFED